MRDEKNTRLSVTAPKRDIVENPGTLHDPESSQNQHITEAAAGQPKIAVLLSMGRENATPLRHLERLTALPGRDVRRRIELERRAGVPILSDNQKGYFLPDNPEEQSECVRSLRHRADEILKTAQAIEKAGGQEG